MPLNRVAINKPLAGFPAGTFNALVEAERGRQSVSQGGPVQDPRFSFLKWKNASGSDAPMGAIVRPTAPLDIKNFLGFSGDKPDGTLRPWYLVALSPVADGKMGDCTLLQPALCHYNTSDGTPAFGESWGVAPGQWYLKKNRPGFFIIGNPSGAGALARVKALPQLIGSILGELSSSLARRSTATAYVCGGAGGSEAAIYDLTVTARDWFMKPGAAAIGHGTNVKIDCINGVWYVTQAECS